MTEDAAHEDFRPERPKYIPGTPDRYDAVLAAPENHEVLIENDRVRVVKVTIEPGVIEKMHMHQWPSVFIITSFPEINYYLEDGTCIPRKGERREGVPRWIEPEGVHAVENVDNRRFEGIRIELKP